MTPRDSWDGLSSPARGVAMVRRYPPPVVLVRDLPRSEAARRRAAGELVEVRRGVLAPPIDPSSSRTERDLHTVLLHVSAFVHHVRADLPVSHQSAALLLGCWVLNPRLPVHVTAPPPPSGGRDRTGDVMRHHLPLTFDEIRLHRDLLVTSIERTAVDCARTLPFLEALTVVDSALRMGADREVIRHRIASLGGARGVAAARRVVAFATASVHSPGETVVRGIALAGGLPRPETLHRVDTEIGTLELEVAWPERGVAVEFDGAVKLAGLRGEALTRQVAANLRREAALVRAGWVVLHLTWSDLADRVSLLIRLRQLVNHRTVR